MLYFEGMRPGNEPLAVNEWSVDEPLCRSGTPLNGKVGGQSKSNNNENAKIKMQVFHFWLSAVVSCSLHHAINSSGLD